MYSHRSQPFRHTAGSSDRNCCSSVLTDCWRIRAGALVLSLLLVFSFVTAFPIAAADDTESSLDSAGPEVLDPSVVTPEDVSSEAELDPELESMAATEDEVTAILRLTELRDQDERRFVVAAESSEVPLRQELKRHASVTQSRVEADLEELPGVTVENDFWITNAIVVTVDTTRVDLTDLVALPYVEYVHENYEVEPASASVSTAKDFASLEAATTEPTVAAAIDPVHADGDEYTYGLEQINAPDVWEGFDNHGEGTAVAVLDTGVTPDHPAYDYDPDNWAEFDDVGDPVDSEPYDERGHGTHVSATVVGGQYADNPAIGVAPAAELYVAGVTTDEGRTVGAIIAGIQWAVENDVDVINMSNSARQYHTGYVGPIENARDAGVVVVTSSGNDGEGEAGSPGTYYDVLSVGASDEHRDIRDSSSGQVVDVDDDAVPDDWPDEWPDEYLVPHVSAPGESVLSASSDGGYQSMSGTSMSSPHVAGAAALVLAENPDLSPAEVEAILQSTAAHPSTAGEQDVRYGYGIVDAHAAVHVAAGGAHVQGRVVTSDGGKPEATIVSSDDGAAGYASPDGVFGLTVEPGERTLTAQSLTFQGTATKAVIVESGEGRSVATIQLGSTDGSAALAGTVTDADTAAPIAGASVVLDDGSGIVAEAETDGRGAYALENLDPGVFTMTVTAEDYEPEASSAELEAGAVTSVDTSLSLSPASLTGTVTAASDGEPIAGASVVLDDGSTSVAETETDDEGTYAIDGIDPGSYGLTVSARDYGPAERTVDLEPGAEQSVDEALVELPATLSGFVIEANSGEPIAGATVTLTDGETVVDTVTDGDGTYEFVDLEPGSYALTISAEGYEPEERPVTLEPDADETLDESLTAMTAALWGFVTDADSGDPIEAASVTVLDGGEPVATDQTDWTGAYEIESIEAGTYALTVSVDDYESAERTVDLEPGVEKRADESLAILPASLSGAVTTAGTANEPIENATVALEDGLGTVASVETGAEGTYLIDGVEPGDYLLRMDAEGHDDLVRSLSLDPGVTETHDEALTPHPASLSGTVTEAGETPAPIEGATVTLSVGGDAVREAQTTEEGGYSLESLVPGTYTLEVHATGFQPAHRSVELEPGAEETVDESLAPLAASLSGTVTAAADGAPIENASVELEGDGDPLEATTDASGAYAFADLEPGSYALTISAAGFETETRSLQLEPAESRLVDQTLTATPATLSGTVTDAATGAPLENATVSVLDGGESIAVVWTDESGAFAIEELEPGSYAMTVSATGYLHAERSVELEPGTDGVEDVPLESDEPSVVDYAADGVVRTDGLRDAIDDWRGDSIGTDLLRDVIDAWRSGESVT